jgi:hypothetical protein
MWCIPQVDGEFVARMEDVLDLYAEAPAKSLSSALRPPPAGAAKSAAMIHAPAVQVSSTSDAAAQAKHPQTNRGLWRMVTTRHARA